MCLSAIVGYGAASGGILVLARKARGITNTKPRLPQDDLQLDRKITDGDMSYGRTNNDAQGWNA